MMNRHTLYRSSAFVILGALLIGCAQQPLPPGPTFEGPLPTVAAQYRTEVREHGKGILTENWRMWRDGERIERENLDAQTGEVWQRDGATLFHTQLYHADQRGIEYQPGDLTMIGASPQWLQQAWIISPDLLNDLRAVSVKQRDGVSYRRYTGSYGGADWDVTLRMDLMLPQLIERKQAASVERIELVEAHPLARAPRQPKSHREYGMIDFADLGDHERDPFVIRLQAQAGGHHAHAH